MRRHCFLRPIAAAAFIFALVLGIFLSAGTGVVFAASVSMPDLSRTGSLSISFRDSETDAPLTGASFTLYQVAALYEDENAAPAYRALPDFSAFSFDNPDAQELPLRLAEHALSLGSGAGKTAVTDENGTLSFSGLSLGIYLLTQQEAARGYAALSPFLVFVPQETDGAWLYDITARPKPQVAATVDISVKKVWNDGGNAKGRLSSVSVQLLLGDAVKDTVVLNEGNHWSHTWRAMAAADGYTVKEVTKTTAYTAKVSSQTTEDGYSFTVTNTAAKLPQTGQLNWPVPLMALSGLFLFAIGFGMVFLKRYESHA